MPLMELCVALVVVSGKVLPSGGRTLLMMCTLTGLAVIAIEMIMMFIGKTSRIDCVVFV